MALELGERFLPRPTTTFTKRRLYCVKERGEGGGRQFPACTRSGGSNPKKKEKNIFTRHSARSLPG